MTDEDNIPPDNPLSRMNDRLIKRFENMGIKVSEEKVNNNSQSLQATFISRRKRTAESVFAWLDRNEYLYPQEGPWHEIYKILKAKESKTPPPTPILLAGWHIASEQQKRDRFIEYIEWADENHIIEEIEKLLLSFPSSEWIKGKL